jgi:hypothetical protein
MYCFYCGGKKQSMDHTPSKNLLEKPYPDNLLTIPSCKKCNGSFSEDEEYFLNVLVEISTNPKLLSKKSEGGKIYKARERSKGLRKLIQDSLVQGDDGMIYFNSDTNRIKRVIEKNAFGLYFHKYKRLAKLDSFNCSGFYPFNVRETRPAKIFMLTYTERFRLKKWITIQDDVFSYIVVRDWARNNRLSMIFHIHNTAWCIIEIPFPYSKKQIRFDIHKTRTDVQLELFNGWPFH